MARKQFFVELKNGVNDIDPSVGMGLSMTHGVTIGKKTRLSIPFEAHISIEMTAKLTQDYSRLIVGHKFFRVDVDGKQAAYTDADLARKAARVLNDELYSSEFVVSGDDA